MKAGKPRIEFTVTKEDIGHSGTGKWHDRFITTEGDTWEELMEMVLDAVNLTFEGLGYTYTLNKIKFK